MRLHLTDRFIAGSKPGSYFDDTVTGLESRVADSGRKVWWFHFVSPRDGKRGRHKLGTYPATPLAQARSLAIEARAHVEAGQDPRAVAEAAAAGMTVADLVRSYLDKHARPNLRSAAALERRLNKNVVPVIGALRLADLHRRDVNRVVDPVLKRDARIEAARTFEDLRAMLRWALARGDLDTNPMAGMQKPATSTPRERVLSEDEVRTLWNGLPQALPRSPACQRVIKLALATGQRCSEVSGMQRSEIDLRRRLWSLPGARTKNGHPHAVPLSECALAIVKEALGDAGEGDFVFPSGDGPLPGHAVATTIRRAQQRFGLDQWTCHDLRRTCLDGMAQLGVAPIVIAHVANHRSIAKAGVTFAHYVVHDYAAEKRAALDLWGERLTGIVAGGAEIVPLAARR